MRRRGGRCAASWKTRRASRRGGCGRCWAGWRGARAGTWSPGGRRIPGTGSTAARCHPGPVLARRARGPAGRAGRGIHHQAGHRTAGPRGRRRSGRRADSGPDVVALREEATAIRKNLEEMAADRALGLITRPQMLAATGGPACGWMRSAPSWSTRRGRTCWLRWWPPRTPPQCGRPGPVPPARHHQDADGHHAALAGPGRPPPVRPGHGRRHLEAARLAAAWVQGVAAARHHGRVISVLASLASARAAGSGSGRALG